MTSTDHLILILLAAVVTFCPRFFPLRIFTQHHIPQWFNEWMKYVPVSLFTALVVKDLFLNSLLVVLVAYRSRSMGLSVVCGLVAVALLTWAFGMA